MLGRAIKMAVEAHHGQPDAQGKPYIMHPLRVMHRLWIQNHPEFLLAAAVLHDVVEDTTVTFHEVKAQCGPRVAFVVLAMTRFAEETYATYITRLIETPGASVIKVADMEDNTDIRRVTRDKVGLMKKYQSYYTMLKVQAEEDRCSNYEA